MKLPCKVIEDLLPMYYDKVCSEESIELVEEHIKACPCCSQMLSDLDIGIHEKRVDDIKPLKKMQKNYKKLRLGWLVAILCILILTPFAFLVGAQHGEKHGRAVDFSKEEAIAYANAFMACLEGGDYVKAYSYWDIGGKKKDLLSGNLFEEEDLATFEEDGLEKFTAGGEKLEEMGGIESFEFINISKPSYANSFGTEKYIVSYTIKFDGKEERLDVSVAKYGIDSISAGDGLIRQPLSHLTLWVQWVVDDYNDQYYDFDLGKWVDREK